MLNGVPARYDGISYFLEESKKLVWRSILFSIQVYLKATQTFVDMGKASSVATYLCAAHETHRQGGGRKPARNTELYHQKISAPFFLENLPICDEEKS